MKKIAVTLTATLLLVVATSLALQSVEGQQSTLTFAASQNLGPCCFWAGTPQISVSGVNVYIVWSQIHDIMFRGSSDNGATYGPVITLASYTDNELVFSPKLIGAGSGVLVAWLVA